MAVNVEIKARVRDMDALRARAEALSDRPCQELTQEDIFFRSPQGRLKLRILAEDEGQLIYYERSDVAGPKSSYYLISQTTEPRTLQAVLEAAWGIRGIVRKTRYLYLVGQTRVHLDRVEGLGDFMELEVVLRPAQSAEWGQATALGLMEALGIKTDDLVTGAYLDLLEAGSPASSE